MTTQRETGTAAPHRVLILGAGYAGMAAVIQLAARTKGCEDMQVTLVNPQERFTERLRLHISATGQQVAEMNIPELLEGTDARFVRGWVTAVDADAKIVRIDDNRVLHYDTLVYGLGSVADTVTVPGVEEHAYTLNTAQDAEVLAERLARLDRGTVVVGGSGLTGVESAAEIAERYPGLNVVLLGRQEPGAAMSPKPKAYLQAALTRLGVQVRSGIEVVKVLPDSVELAGGESVAADVVLWTSGTRVSPLAAAAGLTVDEHGRIVTDATLRSVSHPDVYAVGDAAAIRQGFGVMHGTCQGGMPTGVHAAVSIVRALDGGQPKPFRFGYYHTPVSLGRHDAVVQFTHPDDSPRRVYLTGRVAARYKETVTASPWPTYGRMKKMPASGRYQRETYVGPWLPEPILTVGDTADDITNAESVSTAMLVVLETLSPLERAVFVLKEVFDFSHAEIAQAVERSETAVRQAAHRAREHVRARRPRFTADRSRQRDVTERFLAAATGGDINTLMELLSPDVTLWTDGGGKVRQALRPVVGAQTVAAWFAAIGKVTYQGVEPADMNAELVEINGGPGMVFSGLERIIATVTFDFDADGRITTIHNIANPDKLQAIAGGITRDVGTI